MSNVERPCRRRPQATQRDRTEAGGMDAKGQRGKGAKGMCTLLNLALWITFGMPNEARDHGSSACSEAIGLQDRWPSCRGDGFPGPYSAAMLAQQTIALQTELQRPKPL